jgi:hypothetical protein
MPKSREISNGRAISARPLLCLLFVFFVSALMLLAASAADANQLPEMVLTETSPESSAAAPANSTTPLVMGRGDGGIVSRFQPQRSSGGPIAAVVIPDDVTIYSDSSCTTQVATGTINEVEGSGIQVDVPPDSVTTFYAIQSDPSGVEEPSLCSKTGLSYWESSTVVVPPAEPPSGGGSAGSGGPSGPTNSGAAPPQAPHLRVLPRARANDNFPLLTGSAPGAATVRVFSGPDCGGLPVAAGSAADFAAGLRVEVGDNTLNTFSAVSVAGGNPSPCSTAVNYVEDSTAPRTSITMAPGVKTRRHEAVFRFADSTEDSPGTNFFCKVDRQKWKQCSSPFRLRHLHEHDYVLRIRAIDFAGNAEAKGTERRFKVVPAP